MADSNRAVVFESPGTMKVEKLDFPKLEMPNGRKAPHGVILKIVATNICGSDLHIYRGSFPVPQGMVMGHEMTGEIIEVGSDVEFLKEGDLVSVPLQRRLVDDAATVKLAAQMSVKPSILQSPAAHTVSISATGWADKPNTCSSRTRTSNSSVSRTRTRPWTRSSILPCSRTSFPPPFTDSSRQGPNQVQRCTSPAPGRSDAAAQQQHAFSGASCIIVGDYYQDRLDLVKNNGCETIDLSQDIPLPDQIEAILGEREVDCGVDYVGSEAHGIGSESNQPQPAGAINDVLEATRAGGATGVIGVYGPDPLAPTKAEQEGIFPLEFGKAWIKSPRLSAGQAPIMHYNRELMMSILWDRMPYLSAMLNTKVIGLDEAPAAYETFDHQGSSSKFIIDPHGMIPA